MQTAAQQQLLSFYFQW